MLAATRRVFETLSEVVFELVLPCLAGILALSEKVSSCQSGSDPVSGPGAETELAWPRGMDLASREIAESDVLDGAFSTPLESDVVGSSGSCTAAFVPSGCSSSTGFWGKDEKRKSRICEFGAVLCQPHERVYDCCSLFSRYRVVGGSASGC